MSRLQRCFNQWTIASVDKSSDGLPRAHSKLPSKRTKAVKPNTSSETTQIVKERKRWVSRSISTVTRGVFSPDLGRCLCERPLLTSQPSHRSPPRGRHARPQLHPKSEENISLGWGRLALFFFLDLWKAHFLEAENSFLPQSAAFVPCHPVAVLH